MKILCAASDDSSNLKGDGHGSLFSLEIIDSRMEEIFVGHHGLLELLSLNHGVSLWDVSLLAGIDGVEMLLWFSSLMILRVGGKGSLWGVPPLEDIGKGGCYLGLAPQCKESLGEGVCSGTFPRQ